MSLAVKLIISNIVIIACVILGKKTPALAGLIAAMPLTTLIALTILYSETSAAGTAVVEKFLESVILGIFPTVIFFAVVLYSLKHGLTFVAAIAAGAFAWLIGAYLHRLILSRIFI